MRAPVKKEGRGFFITLLVSSGLLIVVLFVIFSKTFTLFTFKQFVVNKAFVSLLPREYTLERTEAIRQRIYTFYDTAGERGVGDAAVYGISRKIQEIMADEAITHEEVESLLKEVDRIEAQS